MGKHEQLKPVTISKRDGEGSEPPASPKETILQRADNTSAAEMFSSRDVIWPARLFAWLFLESRWLETLPEQSGGFMAGGLGPTGAIPLIGTEQGRVGLGLVAVFPRVG